MQDILLAWYTLHGRHSLIWRNTTDLYHIYLSEIMLQQTQVNRVRDEYYPQFLQKFPTLQALANASLDDVLAAWSGLGYYSRARNLHATARLCLDYALPHTQQELLKLPGIGRYTASAICSFGLNQSVPVVDTNIARVLKRHFALVDAKEKTLWEYAYQFLNHKEPRSHNLALMDLGSLLCLPKNPKCFKCPLISTCLGKEEPTLYTKKRKIVYESLDLFFALSIKDNKIALVKSTRSMYKNMLILPEIDPIEENFIGKFKHSYTKYKIDVHLYKTSELQGNITWLDINEFDTAPISSLTKKVQKFLKN